MSVSEEEDGRAAGGRTEAADTELKTKTPTRQCGEQKPHMSMWGKSSMQRLAGKVEYRPIDVRSRLHLRRIPHGRWQAIRPDGQFHNEDSWPFGPHLPRGRNNEGAGPCDQGIRWRRPW